MSKKEVKKVEEVEVKINSTKGSKKKKYILLVLACILIIAIVVGIFKKLRNDDIKKVSKVLAPKYYDIVCLNKTCDQIAAYKGDKKGKTKVTLLTGDGKVTANYTTKYDSKKKVILEPYEVAHNYFIYKKINTSKNKVSGYSLANKKGKEIYSTDKKLDILNDNLILLDDTDKGINSFSILNYKGKILYKNINDIDVYNDGKVISIDSNGSKEILNEDGKSILSDYYVASEIYDEEGNLLYLLVEDSKNNSYNYFSISSNKIIGDSFQNYTRNGDGTLTISKKENNSVVKYTLYKNGKQKLIGESKTQSDIANKIKKEIDSSKYNVYLSSITDEKQENVFADDLKNKSFGVYNINNKKFTKIFDYKKDASSLYSSISEISNENNLNYYQVSCSSSSCDKNTFYIYDLDNAKTIYSLNNDKLRIQNYYQYTGDYKVIKYSYSTSDEKYKGKYVLYDKDNKELVNSTNSVIVVDEELLIGTDLSSSLILYSSKANKKINSDDSLASRKVINKNVIYRYQNKNNTIILNNKGKEVLKIDSGTDLIYSDKLLAYIKDRVIYMYDVNTSKVKKYKFKENEKMNDAAGDLIAPYRGALFINNSADNYVKIINSKGHIIKKIKKAEIVSVTKNKDNNVVIITKNDKNSNITYGLYIAK